VHLFSKWAWVRDGRETSPAPDFRDGSRFVGGDVLVFGAETTGLGAALRAAWADRLVGIPQGSGVRSLNLANAVAVAAYEAHRQVRWPLPSGDPAEEEPGATMM
jgi:tRNA(Leu) C34 or U34 (ribose-2'-O)-methylase TrmL